MGATNDTLQEHLDILNRKWDSIFEHYPGGKPPILGEKPQSNDPNLLYIRIPNTNLSICFWPGGMEQYGQCCFDFFNPTEHTPVNTPNGFIITPLPQPGNIPFEKKLKSWKEAMQVANIIEGLEKYSAPEGMRLMLTYPEEAPFYFQIPSKPAMGFAQAQASVPPI
ncbi:hypothetical protein OG21DRAFT_1448613 [Imleria badia]|nr:hypothetical protein OG21DRAFT_1448613 [Imleria badia]